MTRSCEAFVVETESQMATQSIPLGCSHNFYRSEGRVVCAINKLSPELRPSGSLALFVSVDTLAQRNGRVSLRRKAGPGI